MSKAGKSTTVGSDHPDPSNIPHSAAQPATPGTVPPGATNQSSMAQTQVIGEKAKGSDSAAPSTLAEGSLVGHST
jgi:hypothetical protein